VKEHVFKRYQPEKKGTDGGVFFNWAKVASQGKGESITRGLSTLLEWEQARCGFSREKDEGSGLLQHYSVERMITQIKAAARGKTVVVKSSRREANERP